MKVLSFERILDNLRELENLKTLMFNENQIKLFHNLPQKDLENLFQEKNENNLDSIIKECGRDNTEINRKFLNLFKT